MTVVGVGGFVLDVGHALLVVSKGVVLVVFETYAVELNVGRRRIRRGFHVIVKGGVLLDVALGAPVGCHLNFYLVSLLDLRGIHLGLQAEKRRHRP